MTEQTPSERFASLGARISEARGRLAKRRDLEWAGIGEMLETLSEDLDSAAHHEDEKSAHARFDDIESRLSQAHTKLDEAENRDS